MTSGRLERLPLTQARLPKYRAERGVAALLDRVEEISSLANTEKESLGFIPEGAYPDAIRRGRLVAMIAQLDGASELAGFVLFSGVFPNARIQQIVVAPRHRQTRVASALLNLVISQLETRGYLTVTAAVASDLPTAQKFYERNGFVARHSRQGGMARGRTIILRARDLDTASFFSLLDPGDAANSTAIDLRLRQRSAGQAPLYAIDLNVLFDLLRDRERSALASKLFGAALAHQIRLAVAPEFLAELQRATIGEGNDPVLRLARQLPRLSATESSEINRLSATIHDIVFPGWSQSGASTPQSISDARHVAEAALSRASGYITSDGKLLAARPQLLQKVGIDIASLDEFVALLPIEADSVNELQVKGANFEIASISRDVLQHYLINVGVPSDTITEFTSSHPTRGQSALGVFEENEVVAVAACMPPKSIDDAARIIIHVRPDHVSCDTFADHLLDVECWKACESGPTTIELRNVPGQTAVRRAAILRGFSPASNGDIYIKVAIGRPITATTWTALARQTRRRTGLQLPETPPDIRAVELGVAVQKPDGNRATIRLVALEEALAPTIVIWPGRDGVIIPITKSYADELLGTGRQLALFGSPEAAFLARRTYFNSPRAAALIKPGLPILFYESRRSGGRGAIIAAARIVDVTVVSKKQVPSELMRRAVVEDVDPLSSSPDVLATTFDNLLRFPVAVYLETLRGLDAVGAANFQTTTALRSVTLSAIIDLGWTRA